MTWDKIVRDETFGWFLIAIGIVMVIWKPFNRFDAYLKGRTEQTITLMLFAVILFYIGIAFFGNARAKAIALFWAVTP